MKSWGISLLCPCLKARINKTYEVFIALTLRCMPFHLGRAMGDDLNTLRKVSSVIVSHSANERSSISGMGLNAASLCGFEKRFHGHTSWHTSQPNIQLSILPSKP